jgi:hypothetical protein
MLSSAPPPIVGDDGGCNVERGPGSFNVVALAGVKLHDAVMIPEKAADNIRYLEELLKALRVRGIRAVFVTTPVSRVYAATVRRESYRHMQEVLASLCTRYSVDYFNHMDDGRFDESDFMDTDHLDSQGATKFTRILRGEIFEGTSKPSCDQVRSKT